MTAAIGHNSRTKCIFRAHGERGYTKLRNEFLQDERISDEARGLVARLLSYPEYWEVTVQAIVQTGKAGRDKVYRMIKEAEKFGYIKPEQPHDQGGKFMRQMYLVSDDPQALIAATAHEILAIEEAAHDAPAAPLTEKPETAEPLTAKPCTDKPFTGNPTQRKEYKGEININMRAQAREAPSEGSSNKQSGYSEQFEAFWKHYPHKEAKGAAYQVWKRLKAAQRKKALEVIPYHAPYLKAKMEKPEGNFCPHPRTWLSHRRFDDPLPKANANGEANDLPEHVRRRMEAERQRKNGGLL